MRTESPTLDRAVAAISQPDEDARMEARAIQARLTKPAGSLGRLEELHVWAAGVFRDPYPHVGQRLVVVAAADHGVACEGISAYPSDVTAQMVRNFLAGGAAVNVFARHAGAEVVVVDAGIAADIDDARIHDAKLRRGTDNMRARPAMSRAEAIELVERGVRFARDRCTGSTAVVLGDMGIGNTTAAAAITALLTGATPRATVGRGTGIEDSALATKVAVIGRAIELNRPDPSDAIDVLAKVGGFEIAFLAGVAVGAASSRAVVILDGYPTTAAALIAASIGPIMTGYMLASHVSAEPGHAIALAHLGLEPLLDLRMRLGEGTGGALAISVLDAALAIPREMATFESAGVSRAQKQTLDER